MAQKGGSQGGLAPGPWDPRGGSVVLGQGEAAGWLVWYGVLLTPERLDLIPPYPGFLNPLSWFSPRFYGKHVVSRERSCLLSPRFPGRAGGPPAAPHRHHRLCEHVGRVLGQPRLHSKGLRRSWPARGTGTLTLVLTCRLSLLRPLALRCKSHQENRLEWGMGTCTCSKHWDVAGGIL